jgi:hypothetical protein
MLRKSIWFYLFMFALKLAGYYSRQPSIAKVVIDPWQKHDNQTYKLSSITWWNNQELVIKELISSHDKTIILDQESWYISKTEARNLSTLNLGCHILVSLHYFSTSRNSNFCITRHRQVSNIIKHNRTSSCEHVWIFLHNRASSKQFYFLHNRTLSSE